jgi:allantoinase
VTTCVDMPYDVPHPVTDAGKLADKIGWVERTAHVDMALYGTILKTGGVACDSRTGRRRHLGVQAVHL